MLLLIFSILWGCGSDTRFTAKQLTLRRRKHGEFHQLQDLPQNQETHLDLLKLYAARVARPGLEPFSAIVMGWIYLLSPQFMSYHADALGT